MLPGMSSPQPWVDRKFEFDLPLSRLPNVLERLRGTPARIEERLGTVPRAVLVARRENKWSIQENAGHLCDVEPIWILRARQVIQGAEQLAPADITNRATDAANHNDASIAGILARFRALRAEFISILEGADDSVLARTARHPRLGTPMRLIDIAFFTAEHDDHHLARISALLRLPTTE